MALDVVAVKATSNGVSAGTATAYTDYLSGYLEYIRYDKPASLYYDSKPDFVITLETSGIGLWTESNVDADTYRAPMYPVYSQLGAAVTYDGTRPIYARIPICNERVKIVVNNAGDATKYGTFYIAYEKCE